MSKPKHMRSAFTVKLSKGRILAYLIYTLPNKGSHTPTYISPSLSTIEPMHYPLERVEERLIGSTIFSIDDSSIRHFLCLSAYLSLPTHYYKFYLMTLLLYCSSMWRNCSTISLLQLDANLIEGEPYNRLARKNKRHLNVARQHSNISEMWETGFKNPPRWTPSVWGPVL